MKTLKRWLRLWLAGASLAGFFGGWALLAHAPKPAPLQLSSPPTQEPSTAGQAVPTLQPLPPLNLSGGGQIQQLPPIQVQPQAPARSFFAPMRTGGS